MFECFENLVNTRQSCREFNDKPLDASVVEKIATLALKAPSACNSQPWKMYLVTEPEKVKAVAESLQERGRNPFASKAKAFVVVSERDATLFESAVQKFGKNHFVKYDIGELVAYLTLGAQSLGVSSCIIGWIEQEKLKKAVGMPEGEVSNIVVALGYSDIPVREKKRKDAVEVIKII